MSRMQLVHLHRTSYGVLGTACVTLPCRAYRDPLWDMRKTNVFGMPSEGSVARGYSVPNFGGVFGMGVKTQTARNDAAPIHHQDRATGRSRPLPAGHRPPERSSEIKEVAVQGLASGHLPRGSKDNGRLGVRSRSHAGRDLSAQAACLPCLLYTS